MRWVVTAGALFLAWTLLSALFSSHLHDALVGWGDYLAVGLCLLLAADLAHRGAAYGSWTRLPALAALYLAVGAAVLPTGYWLFLFSDTEAFFGSFYQANMMAGFLVILLPLAAALFLFGCSTGEGAGSVRPLLTGGLLVLLVVGIYLSYSRGAWVTGLLSLLMVAALAPSDLPCRILALRAGFAAAVLALAVALTVEGLRGSSWLVGGAFLVLLGGGVLLLIHVPRSRGWRVPLLVLCLAAAGMAWAVGRGSGPLDPLALRRAVRLASGGDPSLAARRAFWRAAWEIAREHPFVGVGPDGFHRFHPAHQKDLRWFSRYPHSLFYRILAEQGFVGAGLFLGMVALGVAQGGRLLAEDTDPAVRAARLGLFLGAGGFGVHSLMDVHWQFRALPLFMAVGLGLALGYPASGELPAPDAEDAADPSRGGRWSVRPRMLAQYAGALVLVLLLGFNHQVMVGACWAALAKAASRTGQHRLAEGLYRRAAQRDPWDGEYYRQQAVLMLGREQSPGEQERVLALTARAVALDSHRAVNHSLRGRALVEAGRDVEGEQHLRRALELDPVNYPSFYVDLAELELRRGNRGEALRILEGAVDRFPREALGEMFFFRSDDIGHQLSRLYSTLALALGPQDRSPRVERLLRSALELDPQNRAARFGLGVALFLRGHYEEALPHLERVREEEPDFVPNLEYLRETYFHLGRVEEAREVDRALR